MTRRGIILIGVLALTACSSDKPATTTDKPASTVPGRPDQATSVQRVKVATKRLLDKDLTDDAAGELFALGCFLDNAQQEQAMELAALRQGGTDATDAVKQEIAIALANCSMSEWSQISDVVASAAEYDPDLAATYTSQGVAALTTAGLASTESGG